MQEEVLQNKEAVVEEITEKFKNAQSVVVVEYRGLSVAETMDLRRQLRAENVDFKVYKNTMVLRAIEKAGFSEMAEVFSGPNALAFSDDAITPSRILANYARKRRKLVIKSGIIEGHLVDADKIKEVAILPNHDGMISMILGCLQTPMRNLAYAIKSVAELKTE